jgi:CheY-like chemotaxis protein
VTKRVLVVEDDDTVRELIVRTLSDAGHVLRVAADGESALAIWREDPSFFDALVTDVIMPVMSGPSLAATLRRERPELPVVFVSGYAADRVGEDALGDGRTRFVQKPFELHDLVSQVDSLFEG